VGGLERGKGTGEGGEGFEGWDSCLVGIDDDGSCALHREDVQEGKKGI